MKKKNKRGYLIVDALIFLCVLGIVFVNLSRMTHEWEYAQQGAALSSWWVQQHDFAKRYLNDYASDFSEIIDAAPGTVLEARSDAVVGMNSLPMDHQARQGLRVAAGRTLNRSIFGQDVVLYIYKTDADDLLHGLLMAENGTPWRIPNGAHRDETLKKYMLAANKARGVTESGVVGTRDNNGNLTADGNIYGLRQEWQMSLADIGLNAVPSATQPGQLIATMEADIAESSSNTLYRDEVPDHPELNAMNTDLHMNGWTIDNAGTITISNDPHMVGGSGELSNVPPGGNGLVIDPVRLAGDMATTTVGGNYVATSAQSTCDADGGKPDGFIFTMNNAASSTRSSDPRDANGIYVCIGGKARQLADSGNSSMVKDITMVTSQAVIRKPLCPEGTLPQIYIAPVNVARAKEVPAITAVRTQVEETTLSSAPAWRVRLRMKTVEDDIPGNNFYVEEGRSWSSLGPGNMPQPAGFNSSGSLATSYTNAMAFSMCVRTTGSSAADANYPNSIRTDTADGITTTNWRNSTNGGADR